MSTPPHCPCSISLPATASPSLHGALKEGFREAVVARDMPEPYTYPPRGTCQERLLWTHKEFEVALHPVVGLELRVGDAEKFPQALGLESLGQFFWKTASRIRVSQPQRRMEVTITYAIVTPK